MRGSSVGWMLAILGLLGVIGWLGKGFQPSIGLLIAGGVTAVLAAQWIHKARSETEEVHSPLHGTRRVPSKRSEPTPMVWAALASIWLFTVYGAGKALVYAGGTKHTRLATVLYTLPFGMPSPGQCRTLEIVLHGTLKPTKFRQCNDGQRDLILSGGMIVTYPTRESPLGTISDPRFSMLTRKSIADLNASPR